MNNAELTPHEIAPDRGVMRRMLRHRLVRNTGALTLVQLVTYVTPVVTLVYLNRILGLQLYGVVAFAFAMVQVANVILDLGFSLSATAKISQHRHRPRMLSRLVGAILALKVAGLLLASVAIIAFAGVTERYAAHFALLVWGVLPLAGYSLQPLWYFAGIERMGHITLLTLCARVLGLMLLLLLVTDPTTYVFAMVADGIGQALGALLGLTVMVRLGCRPRWPRRRDLAYVLALTRGYFASRLAVLTYVSSGVFLLGLFGSQAAVGAYSIAERFYQVLQQVFSPIVQAAYPYLVKERAVLILARISLACVGLATALAVGGYFSAPELVSLLFGTLSDSVVPVLNVFLLGIVVHVANILSGYPLAAVVSRPDMANRSVIAGAVVYAVGVTVIVSTGHASAWSFAWLMVGTESFILTLRAFAMWPAAWRQLRSLNVDRGSSAR